MVRYQTRFFGCILILTILISIIYSIRNTTFISTFHHTDDADIYEFVPEDLRRYYLKSSSTYTIEDLLNITKLPNNTENYPSNSASNPIHLITQWYYETNLRRRQELVSVLHMNVINNATTKIHFVQNSKDCTIFDDIKIDQHFPSDLLKSKLIIHYDQNTDRNQRLTIKQALHYANRFITNGYTILLNLDIFFDQSLSILKHRPLIHTNTIFYLSRYEVDLTITTGGLQCSDEHYVGSHDALVFQTPLSDDVIEQYPFELGTWHYEVKIIYELVKANYTVRNPCKSIRIWHLHSSQIRHRLMPTKKYLSRNVSRLARRYPEFL